jgi:hypothetical protein
LRIPLQQAVNNAIHVPDTGIELQLERISSETVTGAQYPDIPTRFYPVINNVVIRLIGVDDGLTSRDFNLPLQAQLPIGPARNLLNSSMAT